MKLKHHITINESAEKVWKILALDFDTASEWMASVPTSTLLDNGYASEGAPMEGRTCQFGVADDSPKVEERFTYFNNAEKRFNLLVKPITGKLPIVQNHAGVEVVAVSNTQSKVLWNSTIELTTTGKIMKPILRLGLNRNLNEILEELKYFAEQGTPHPRKLKALAKAS